METFVTERELNAHLEPIRNDLGEVKADVKSLLLAHAGQRAVSKVYWKYVGIAATLCCGLLTGFVIH